MTFIRAAWIKDLRRVRRDPLFLVSAVAIPLIIGFLLGLISGDGKPPTAHLLVKDLAESMLSGFLVTAFGQGPLENMVVTETVADTTEGRRRMDAGKASGFLIIPEGFGKALLAGDPTELTLITNPAQSILPRILEETLDTFADAVNEGHAILGDDVTPMFREISESEGIAPDQLVAEVSVAINGLVRRAKPFLSPAVIRVETEIRKDPLEDRSFAEIFFPSLFFMSLIFTAQALSHDVWLEQIHGTLRRAMTTPGGVVPLLAGKLLSGATVLALISLVALSLARWGLGIGFHNLLGTLAFAVLFGMFMELFFMVLQTLASNSRSGNLLANAVLFPLIMVGGSFFPFEAMPAWMARIGRLTPNGWSLLMEKSIMAGTVELPQLLSTLGGLLVLGGVFYLLSLRRLRAFARS